MAHDATPQPTERTASGTAVGVALLRAAHQIVDAEPLILRDPVAFRVLAPEAEAGVRAHAERFATPGSLGLRSHVVVRSRYAEDRLAQAFARGVRQYVLLGAGLDTFAYRQPAWAGELRIFEVDQPATQQAKRERLAAGDLAIPPNVRLVPVDFERQTLRDGLLAGGVDPGAPVFCSWLGVTTYLTEGAVFASLRTVAELPAGTEIVFTFSQPDRAAPSPDPERQTLAERAAAIGEPWLSFFWPDDLEARLRGLGFREVTFLTPAEAEARYFAGRTDALPPPRRTSICAAVV